MEVGDLVKICTSSCQGAARKHHDRLGIITDVIAPINHQLWFDDNIISVLYPDTGEEMKWSENSLEMLAGLEVVQ